MTQQQYYRAADLCGTAKSRKEGKRGILTFSPKTLWNLVREGKFPAPVKLSEGVTAFPAAAVDKWIAERNGKAA